MNGLASRGGAYLMMRKRLRALAPIYSFAAVCIITLGGCVAGTYLTKPGFTHEQFMHDAALCRYEATLVAEQELEKICVKNFVETYTYDSAFRKCTALITSFTVEKEYSAEGMMRLQRLCMMRKGYVETTWP